MEKIFIIGLLFVLLTACNRREKKQPDSLEEESIPELVDSRKNLQSMNYQFNYQESSREIQLNLDQQLKAKYTNAPHAYSYTGNRPPANWREDYYKMFISTSGDQAREILLRLKQQSPDLSQDEYAEMAIAFVQGGITYDWDSFHNIDQSQIRYPLETLLDKTGVCSDKSLLLAWLLKELGYGLAVFTFERANHMALGILVPAGNDDYRSGYAFVESTDYAPVGRIPDNYTGGMRLGRSPKVVVIHPGNRVFEKIVPNRVQERALESKYGKNYFFLSPEQKSIKVQMTELETELTVLKKEMRGCNGTLSQEKYEACNQVQKKHNTAVEKYNALVARFNALNKETPA